jgi:hypothetical protein
MRIDDTRSKKDIEPNEIGSYGGYESRYRCRGCRKYKSQYEYELVCSRCGTYISLETGRWKIVGYTYYLWIFYTTQYEWEPKE